MKRRGMLARGLLAGGFCLAHATGASGGELVYPDGYIHEQDAGLRFGVMGVNIALAAGLCAVHGALVAREGLPRAVAACAGGGAVEAAGMELAAHPEILVLPGIGKRVTETGASIIENTLLGLGPLEKLRYSAVPLFPAMIEIDTGTGLITPYWSIAPFMGLMMGAASGGNLDPLRSLSWRSWVFSHDRTEHGCSSCALTFGTTLGETIVVVSAGNDEWAAHELTHAMQYVRYRPMQALVPDGISVLERIGHYRLGEDAVQAMMWFSSSVSCEADADQRACTRRWWLPGELEAYITQAAAR